MHMKSWLAVAGLAVAGMMVMPANADVAWSGPGYYVVDAIGDFISGPYKTEVDCKSAISVNEPQVDQGDLNCDYDAKADARWAGPGYYIEFPSEREFMQGGPYSSEADCEAALSVFPPDDRTKERCFYEASAPTNN